MRNSRFKFFWCLPYLCLLGAFLLGAGNSSAQNTYETITSADFTQLKQAFQINSSPNTNVISCQFNGTITVTTPLFAVGNTILEVPTNYTVTIAGSTNVRIFQVQPGVSLVLSNLTISGGNALGTNGNSGIAGTSYNSGTQGHDGNPGLAAGDGYGGAIYNQGNSLAMYCIFVTNTAVGGTGGTGGSGGSGTTKAGQGGSGGNGGKGLGGAIYNIGSLTISNCDFIGNGSIGGTAGAGGTNGSGPSSYPGNGGTGGYASGGAIYNLGILTNWSSAFVDNFCHGGTSQATGQPQANQGAQGPDGGYAQGGAIYNGATNITVNCTLAQNTTQGGTGGNGSGPATGGSRGGNGGSGGLSRGGGFFNYTGAYAYITNCTFAGGSCYGGTNGLGGTNGTDGSIGQVYGGNLVNLSGVTNLVLKNSILAYPTNIYNTFGTFTDGGYNISSDSTPTFTVQSTSTNSIDPKLVYPLATNGGPTLTLDLEPDSPAIDRIPLTNPATYPTNDQRNFPRPMGTKVDIGAVEYGTPSFTISGYLLPQSAGYSNVTIVAAGSAASASTMPDSNGFYTFSLPADTYTITPQPTNGFSFFPLFLTATVGPTNQAVSNQNFNATATFKIGGFITNLTASVTVNAYTRTNGNNTFYLSTTTGTDSVYIFTNLPAGDYTIIPVSSTTVAFTPSSFSITVSMDNTNLNFKEVPPQFSLGGTITNSGGAAITVYANIGSGNTLFASTTADVNGNYSFTNLPASSYTLVPQTSSGFTFTPSSIFITVPPSTNNQNFTAQSSGSGTGSVGSYGVTGFITNLPSAATVNLYFTTNAGALYAQAVTTNSSFTFSNLPAGDFTIVPQTTNWMTYSPSNLLITLASGNQLATNQNFSVLPPMPFFTNQISLGSNVYYLANSTNNFFGYYSLRYFPYVYHYDLGFSYFIDASNATHGAYLYDFTSGHFWYTEPGLLPYFYDFNYSSWLYCYPNYATPETYFSHPRDFYKFSDGTYWFD